MADNFTPLDIPNREGAPDGNQNALKYDTPEKRQELCEKYIAYITQGFSKEYFPECSIQTFEKYVEQFPVDFDTEKIASAEREGMHMLERTGFAGMLGQLEKFNPTAWIFIVKNRLKWKDRSDFTSDDQKIEAPVIYKPEKNTE